MNIPQKLRSISQWIVWRYETKPGSDKPAKVPYQVNGLPCTVTNRDHCSTFEEALAVVGQYSGLGFCFFSDDGVSGVDCDNPFEDTIDGRVVAIPRDDPEAIEIATNHTRIITHLDSYTELSPSRMGAHTFVFGKLPPEWRKRGKKIEIYGQDRFFTVTGELFPGLTISTDIEDRQFRLEEVAKSVGLDKVNGHTSDFVSQAETRNDVEVYNAIINSKTGDAFKRIYHGAYGVDGLKSEDRLNLINYICHFTNNRDQAERIFRSSPFFATYTKIHDRDDLIRQEIDKGFDKKPPPIDLTALSVTAHTVQEMQAAPDIAPETTDEALMHFPEGALGFIASYIYNSAPYPIAEYALGGAIGLLSAICGRAWNIEGAGLNCYVAIVGRSGSGKDAVQSGITRLLGEYDTQIPAARSFLGARSIASAQALSKMFDPDKGNSPSQVSIIPEFGEFLNTHTDARADGTKRALIADFLAIYGVSGHGQEFGSMVYSDRDKNVKALKSPSFSMIGDTVAESFYEACTEAQMIKGLVPRMSVFERKAPRPQRNEQAHLWRPDTNAVLYFGYIITRALELNNKNVATPVGYSVEAKQVFAAFDKECDDGYRNNSDAVGNIYSRAPLKAKKMAALCAVGMQWLQPVITEQQALWACELARRDIKNFTSRINSGEIATSSSSHSAYTTDQRAFAGVYVRHVSRAYETLNEQHAKQVTKEAHCQGYMRASTFRGLAMQTPGLRKDLRKDQHYSDVMRHDFSGILKVGTPHDLNLSQHVSQYGLKPDVTYVIATDIALIKAMAGPQE